MLQPSTDLHPKSFVLTGVRAALFLLPKYSPLDCRKWVHKKLFCMPAAKLHFCPGFHHTICQCGARHLLLGFLPSPAGLSVKPKLWKMQLWSYNNFICWILHHSVSSRALETSVFSGNPEILGSLSSLITCQEFWFCSYSLSSSLLFHFII